MKTQSQNWESEWAAGGTPKILTIDDDALVRQSIVVYLEDCGYEVVEANDGRQGINRFRSENPDLVLCDLRMPEIDGMSVLEVITRENPDTPVIIISGAGMVNDVVESLRLGAIDYLVKPISDLEVLGHAVKQALSKLQLEQENLLYKKELERANRELNDNLNVLQQDQEAGRRAQLQLLPPPTGEFGEFEFSHTVIPSLNLSGDFLDYFEIDERFIGFYIADVSGHGSASAFVTMMLKSLFNQPIRNYRINSDPTILYPDLVLSYLNDEILKAKIGKHVTVFYGVIDTQNYSLDYSVGGHFPRPVVIQDGVKRIIQDRGFPIGLFNWATFDKQTLAISKSFSLINFSDGILECLPEKGAEVQEACLLDIDLDAQTLASDIIERLAIQKLEKLPDDVSILVVRRKE